MVVGLVYIPEEVSLDSIFERMDKLISKLKKDEHTVIIKDYYKDATYNAQKELNDYLHEKFDAVIKVSTNEVTDYKCKFFKEYLIQNAETIWVTTEEQKEFYKTRQKRVVLI